MRSKGNNDSEADEASGGESDHTNSTHDTTDEEANEPESDVSSEMDFSEIEKRRAQYQQDMNALEEQFNIIREQYYEVRSKLIEKQLMDVRNECSAEYISKAKEHENVYNRRIAISDILYKLNMENVNHQDAAEKQASKQQFESEAQNTLDELRNEVHEKIKTLEEERHNADISLDDWSSCKRVSRVRGRGRKKPVLVSGPYIVYMIEDAKIMEDWTIIRKALKRIGVSSNSASLSKAHLEIDL